MSLVLLAPMFVLLFMRHKNWLAARWKLAAALGITVAALLTPYALSALREVDGAPGSPMESPWKGFVFPLMGGRLFSGLGFGYFLGMGWPWPRWARALSYLSAAAIPLVWFGILRTLLKKRRSELDVLALSVVGLQCLVYGFARVYGHPHYLGPAWLLSLYFLWSGLTALGEWTAPAGAVYGGALAGLLLFTMHDVHARGGTRGLHYGPTLANQLEVARALDNFKPGPIDMEARHYELFPQALSTIMDLYDLKGNKDEQPQKLAIVYLHPDGADGWIRLVQR
jgi:hypothetical protein